MQIFLIFENKRFSFQINNDVSRKLQVKYLISKLPKEKPIHDNKEYIIVYEDEVFKVDDYIDFEKYNNKEFALIFLKRNTLTDINLKDSEETKKINYNSAKLTMAQMIKKLTNAKEEIKPIDKRLNQYLNSSQNSHIMINSEYEVESDLYLEEDLEEEEYDSDVIRINDHLIGDSYYSLSDVDVSMNSLINGVDPNMIIQMISMGFSSELSENALRITNNRIDIAIEFLMQGIIH